MADIKYLAGLDIDGNINLNKNSLNNAAIQALSSNPSSPATAQIYYNTGSNELRIYSGSTWIAVGSDTDNYVDGGSFSGGTLTLTRTGSLADIDITGFLQIGTTSTTALAGNTDLLQLGTTSTTALAGNTTTITSSQATAISTNSNKVSFPGFGTTSGTALEGDTTLLQLGTTSTTALAGDTTTITSSQASAISTNSSKVSFPGFGTTSGKALEGDTTLLQLGTTSTTALAGNTTTISSAQTTKLGHITVTQAVDLDDMETDIGTNASNISTNTSNISTNTSSISTNATAIGGKVAKAGDTMTGALTLSGAPTANLHAATKAYVDTVVTGQLVYQGGYNAAAAPPTGSSVKKGFTYTVTIAGDGNGFFTIPLEIGDLIIAQQDNPTTQAHWTEVNKNVDLATTTTVGVASFSSDNFGVSNVGVVTIKNGGVILGTETTGDYVSDLTGGTNVSVSGATGSVTINGLSNSAIGDIAEDEIEARQYQGLFGNGSATSYNIDPATHGITGSAVAWMVQLVKASDGETVYAEVKRDANSTTGRVQVNFSSAPGTNAIRILINKIG